MLWLVQAWLFAHLTMLFLSNLQQFDHLFIVSEDLHPSKTFTKFQDTFFSQRRYQKVYFILLLLKK